MSKPVFVDTSAWFALQAPKDEKHAEASLLLPRLVKSRPALITSNHVLGESYTLVRQLLGHQAATDFIKSINRSRKVECLFTPHELENRAFSLLERYNDQDFSFVDATSFVWMKKLRIREAFAFDKHFTTAGFVLIG